MAQRVTVVVGEWLATPRGQIAALWAALVLRLWLAHSGGHHYDIAIFNAWTKRLSASGIGHFYTSGDPFYKADYPPGYMYVLWLVGKIARVSAKHDASAFVLKLPAMFADLGMAFLVLRLAERIVPRGFAMRKHVRGFLVIAILFNPAVVLISALWGQVDSVAALLVLGAFVFFLDEERRFSHECLGSVLLGTALTVKPQSVLVFPVVFLLLFVRTMPRGVVRAGGRVLGLLSLVFATWTALLAPFGLSPAAGLRLYETAAKQYDVATSFAFNLWGVFGGLRADHGSGAVKILGVQAIVFGTALFSLVTIVVLVRSWRLLRLGIDEGIVLVLGASSVAIVAFAVLTRMHERYLYMGVVILAVGCAWPWIRRMYFVLSGVFLVNLLYTYLDHYKGYGLRPPPLGRWIYSLYGQPYGAMPQRVISGVTAAVCVLVASFEWRAVGLRRRSVTTPPS